MKMIKFKLKMEVGGDSGKVFFIKYSDNKVFFSYQIGYHETPKYLSRQTQIARQFRFLN